MGYLRINKIIYSGKKYRFESEDFDKNIILIEGDNGTGKSTFCNLIYFGLGGEVPFFRKNNDIRHTQIVSDTDNYVDLYTTISGHNYILRRYIEDNDITVIPYVKKTIDSEDGKTAVDDIKKDIKIELLSEETKNYPINRYKNNYIFSDWILENLGISVVELFHGYQTFKVNYSDLMRLIYHDQQPDPESIYKKPDTKSTMVSDSEVARNAIFELLVGKSYSDYYDSIVEEKKLAKERAVAKGLVDEYKSLADGLRFDNDVKNISFLQADILQKEEQLEKLQLARTAFKLERLSVSSANTDIEKYKSEFIKHELLLSELKEKLIGVLDERYRLSHIRTETNNEIAQIWKIIFSHDQLNLFTADTCPYCLNKVTRAENKCVCGADIEKEQYERFFYTSQEYKEIYRSKIKTLTTIDMAYDDCNGEVGDIKCEISSTEETLIKLKNKFELFLEKIDEPIDIESINDIDDMVLQVREEISTLNQLLDVETKLHDLQDKYETLREKAQQASLNRKRLEITAKQDIAGKIKVFSDKYNDLMVETLPDCRSARIKLENYMPLINDGEYKEASSRVSTRLMYYITMMHLALEDSEVTFPRFLLVDTPETAGIELGHLVNCISKFEEFESYGENYQVILATGLNKYPESMRDKRVLYMPDKLKEHMLLQEI